MTPSRTRALRKAAVIGLPFIIVLAGSLAALARLQDAGSAGRTIDRPAAAPIPAPAESPGTPGPPVSGLSPSPDAPPSGQPEARPVTARPGMQDVRPVTWRRAEVTGERTVRIFYESGVEPCSVLDRVEVQERLNQIVVTLYEGSDPASKNQICIMIAQSKAVDVALGEPVGGRALVDGAD